MIKRFHRTLAVPYVGGSSSAVAQSNHAAKSSKTQLTPATQATRHLWPAHGDSHVNTRTKAAQPDLRSSHSLVEHGASEIAPPSPKILRKLLGLGSTYLVGLTGFGLGP